MNTNPNRWVALAYGAVCYGIFFATFLYAGGFIGDLWVPKSIDRGGEGSLLQALLVNTGLLALFAVQHSVMARQGFKRWWTRIVPRPVERATYVLASSAALILLFAAWVPVPTVVWSFGGAGGSVLLGLYFLGLATVLYATCLIDHFDLFGLRQVVLYFRGVDYTEKRFVTPSLYRHVRHPLYVGWLMTMWFTPHMTIGHLFFAAVGTAYIFVALVFEERDLVDMIGEDYRRYRATTPMIVPKLTPRAPRHVETAHAR